MTSSVKPSPFSISATVKNFADRPSVKNAASYTFSVAKSAILGGLAGKAVEYAAYSTDTTNQLALTGAIAAATFEAAMPITNRLVAYTNRWSTQASKLLGGNQSIVMRHPSTNIAVNSLITSIITAVGVQLATTGTVKTVAELLSSIDLPHALINGGIAPRITEALLYIGAKTFADQVETVNAVVQDVKAVRDERAAQTKAAIAAVAAKAPAVVSVKTAAAAA